MHDTEILDTATAAHADLNEPRRTVWDSWGAELLVGALLAVMCVAAIALYPVVLV